MQVTGDPHRSQSSRKNLPAMNYQNQSMTNKTCFMRPSKPPPNTRSNKFILSVAPPSYHPFLNHTEAKSNLTLPPRTRSKSRKRPSNAINVLPRWGGNYTHTHLSLAHCARTSVENDRVDRGCISRH